MLAKTASRDFVSFEIDVPVGDIALRCTSFGSGPTVVLLHAGGENRRVWSPIGRRLAADGFRAVAVDQRGHGETGGAVGRRLDAYAADLRTLLAWLNVPVVLVGSSLGGLASLLAVSDSTTAERVGGLVLVDVRPDPDPIRARLFLQAIEAAGSGVRAPRWEWSLIDDILSRSDELRAVAASLTMPVTLVRGTASEVLGPAEVEQFRSLVPHAEIRAVHGAGHLVARDRPQELVEVLLEHFAGGPLPWRSPGLSAADPVVRPTSPPTTRSAPSDGSRGGP